jgi:hypothetical protein
MRVINSTDFFWLVGILEGEGTFLAGPPSARGQPIVRVSMTDRDVVDRVGTLIDRAVVPVRTRRAHHKTPYVTCIKGAPAVALMRALLPHMSVLRTAQIQRAVASWHGHRTRARRASGHCSARGCPRPVTRRGLCKRHYDRWWKACRRGRAVDAAPSVSPELAVKSPGGDLETDESAGLAWLAGLLEGEGTFAIQRDSTEIAYPRISLTMCDRATVERAARLMGAPSVTRKEPRDPDWSVSYFAAITGHQAATWMHQIRGLMGARRRASIDAALASYHPIRLVDAPASCVVPDCDEPHRGRGLCHRHYMMWSRDRANGRAARIVPLR